MKIIFALILSILAIDIVAYATFFSNWYVLPAFLIPSFLIVRVLKNKNTVSAKDIANFDGWSVGKGVEVTNPHTPEEIDNIVLQTQALNLGMMFIGSPGAGKSVTCIGYLKFFYKELNIGYSYMEAKGQIDLYQKCRAAGCEFDYFFSTILDETHSINLMAGDPDTVAERLSKTLIGTTSSTSFYSDEQRAVILKVVPLLCNLGTVNMRDLYAALTVEEAGRECIALAKEKGIPAHIISDAESFFNQEYSDRMALIKGMLNRLFVFVSGKYSDRINAYEPDIDLYRDVNAGKRFYFHLPLSDFSRDVAIMISETFSDIATKRQIDGVDKYERFPLVYDDWSGMFHSNFTKMAARVRSAKMPLTFGFQSRSQLREVTQTFEDDLDDNLAIKVVMRVMGEDTGDYGVRMVGEYESLDINMSHMSGRDGTSIGTKTAPRIEKRDLKNLPAGAAYVSTIEYLSGGEARNRIYKLRFPLPYGDDWEDQPTPQCKPKLGGDGLHLYDRYFKQKKKPEIDMSELVDA